MRYPVARPLRTQVRVRNDDPRVDAQPVTEQSTADPTPIRCQGRVRSGPCASPRTAEHRSTEYAAGSFEDWTPTDRLIAGDQG